MPAAQTGTAFLPTQRTDLDRIFSIHHDRTVNQDNTVRWINMILQIQPQQWRSTLAGCRVLIYEHLDDTFSIGYGPHLLGRYTRQGQAIRDTPHQPHAQGRSRKKRSAKTSVPYPKVAILQVGCAADRRL